jgi:hypothetical protein
MFRKEPAVGRFLSSALWNLPETGATIGGDRIFGDFPETWTRKSNRSERYHTYEKNRYHFFHHFNLP